MGVGEARTASVEELGVAGWGGFQGGRRAPGRAAGGSEEPRGALPGAGPAQRGRGLSLGLALSQPSGTSLARRAPPSRRPLPALAASPSSRSLPRPPGACPQVVKRP